MEYLLGKCGAGTPEVEIDKTYFELCKASKTVLGSCLAIEEKYEILTSNFFELENHILRAATSYMIRRHVDYSVFFDLQLMSNLRVVNLLTSARLYIDQLYAAVRRCMPDIPDPKADVKTLMSEQYDKNPNYRFMEALRNHVQHKGLAVHGISLKIQKTDESEKGLIEYTFEFVSKKAVLSEDDSFKKQVLVEIPDQIDLKIASRSYVESLSTIHNGARELISASVSRARSVVDDAYHRYERVYEGDLDDLSIHRTDGFNRVESVDLVRQWDDVRVQLQKRNERLVNLHKKYATGKPTQPDN